MENEEYIGRIQEILEEIDCWNGLENEVLKLFALFSCCLTQKADGQKVVNVEYVKEKIYKLLNNSPIILDHQAKRVYCSMRIAREK